MNYATIKPFDVANGPGVRVSLFVSGCTHRCKGCFNEEAWDFSYGEEFTEKEADRIIEALSPGYIRGFSLLGGEPFEPANQKELAPLLERIKKETNAKIVMLAPYVLDCEGKDEMREDLKTVLPIIRSLAAEYADVYIPLDELFAEAIKTAPEALYYSKDGVHPNENGARFIGKLYADAIEALL